MQDQSQCRERTEGWIGRRRTYICRECHNKFRVDRVTPLPQKERICLDCKEGHNYVFTDRQTNQETHIKASDAELATLRAWKANPNLTFKIPQPKLTEAKCSQ